jgi:hypothetical protein
MNINTIIEELQEALSQEENLLAEVGRSITKLEQAIAILMDEPATGSTSGEGIILSMREVEMSKPVVTTSTEPVFKDYNTNNARVYKYLSGWTKPTPAKTIAAALKLSRTSTSASLGSLSLSTLSK